MNARPNFSIPDGTEQADRLSPALESGYFQPDERRLDETLALGFDIARTLTFYDLSNKRKGTWGDLFTANEAVIMAHILSTDPSRLDSGFTQAGEKGLEHGVQFAFETAHKLDLWLTSLGASRSRVAIELSERIQPLMSAGLTTELQKLAQIITTLRPGMPSLQKLSFDRFHRMWGIRQVAGDTPLPVWNPEKPLRDEVREIITSLLSVTGHLHAVVRPYLAESLRSQQHEPAIALFIVFLKLLEKANGRLNRFTERHLDFYYQCVLGTDALLQRPDHLFFTLLPTEEGSEVLFRAGTELVTTVGESGGEIVFLSERDILVSDARVDTLCTLRFERDRFISPETELGYVTRIKALQRDLNSAEESGTVLSDWPLFGTSSRLAGYKRAQDARIGFALASPLLLLGEGRRTIEILVELGSPVASEGCDGYDLFRRDMRSLLERPAGGEQAFHRLLGRIFRYYILAPSGESMSSLFRQELNAAAGQLLHPQAREAVKQLLCLDPEALFQRLLKDVFDISLTIPSGWYVVDRFAMTRLGGGQAQTHSGLRFRFTLGSEVDPIVPYTAGIHGGQLDETSPLIRFQLNPQASFCVYSLFDTLRLEAITVDVRVQGVRDLKLYNNTGEVDPSKPFQPFGPLPGLSSYFAFGSYEMAQKRLTALTLNLEWADLPTSFGGFATHYTGYGRAITEADFRADISLLQDGVWRPKSERQRPAVSLFQSTAPTDRLKATRSIEIEALDLFRSVDEALDEAHFDLQMGAGNGFVRLGLSGREGAFGHAEYPILLSRALAQNIRSKKPLAKVPNAPYTPLIADVSVDYAARARISVDDTRTEKLSQPSQRVFHLHPFGYEAVWSTRVGNPYLLLPRYDSDGNLFIGISGGRSGQALTLFFELNEESSQQAAFQSPATTWYYLSAQGWQTMPPMNIVLDTTNGFICSGIVTLILPRELDRQSTLMPAGKAWIRVGANERLDSLPRLCSVHTNVVQASRQIDTDGAPIEYLSPERVWRTAEPVPGIGEVSQLGGSHGGSPKESRRHFLTRTSERLRHKARAVNVWDYERLILERFPEVFKVKCFEGLVSAGFNPEEVDPKPTPGHVLIIVVPAFDDGDGQAHRRPMLNVLQLNKIHRFIRQIASPFVEIEVRNPLYERVQVRCKAKFVDDTNAGFYVRKLNADVSGFLCPWIPFGCQARFGWMISRDQVEGFIRDRDYVEYITDFSMLHITEDDADLFTLADTVSRNARVGEKVFSDKLDGSGQQQGNRVRWRYPWSLAVPMERHFIEATREIEPIDPEPAGIGELDIGSTFIIGGTH
ncbi:MAG: hypothetical protein GY792_13140 [Gammaproteobacteria bacterium]|nr:hypothetical protein [Gammaproteobacteria bacterium]